jgi:hypothetical protein
MQNLLYYSVLHTDQGICSEMSVHYMRDKQVSHCTSHTHQVD